MITLVGMGPGDVGSLTLDAVSAIRSSDVVLAFSRLAETARVFRDDVQVLHRLSDMDPWLDGKGDVVILVSGDPFFYGLGGTLAERGVPVDRVIPGISSMQYAAAKAHIPWQDMAFFSFHGREMELEPILKTERACVLLDRRHSATAVSEALKEAGAKGTIDGFSHLSYEGERVEKKMIGEPFSFEDDLALVVIEFELDL